MKRYPWKWATWGEWLGGERMLFPVLPEPLAERLLRRAQTLEQLLQYPRSVRALVIQHDFLRAPSGLVPRGTWRRVSPTHFELVSAEEVTP